MSIYKNLFMQHMDSEGIRYTDHAENVVKVVYNGDELETIPIFVMFDKDGQNLVTFKCWNIASFKGKEEKAYVICNELNAKWRWIKFYIDDDADIIAEADAMIDTTTGGEECLSMVRRMVNIVDESYPTVAKARWA